MKYPIRPPGSGYPDEAWELRLMYERLERFPAGTVCLREESKWAAKAIAQSGGCTISEDHNGTIIATALPRPLTIGHTGGT